MRILFVDQYSDLGGAQKCLLDLLPAVQQRDWQPHVAVPGNGPLVGRLAEAGVPAYSIPCKTYSAGRKSLREMAYFAFELPRLTKALRALVEKTRADLIYANGPRVLPAAARACGSRVPLLFHCHNHLRQPVARRLAGRALQRSRATVVACCRFSIEPLLPYVGETQLHLVYNGVDASGKPAGRRPQESLTIGVVGRIAPDKGQAEFLEAARIVSKKLPASRFVVCGDAVFDDPAAVRYRDSLQGLAEGLPVEFLGWKNDIAAVMATLDLLVVPSVWEAGAPRVILEAYACSVPVVACATGGIPEILIDGEAGYLAQPATPERLAERILKATKKGPEKLSRLSEAARTAWKQRFTLERYQTELLAVMDWCASKTGRAR